VYETVGPNPLPNQETIVSSKVKTTEIETPSLNLVFFKRFAYPLGEADFTLLRQRKVTVGKIPEMALQMLRRTLLQGVRIVELRWVEIYDQLLEQFRSSFPDDGTYAFKNEANWILVRTDTKDKAARALVSERIAVLRSYAGRYGFALRSESRERDDVLLTRATFVADPEIVPSHHFRTHDIADSGVRLNLHLSGACRLVLENKKSPIGVPTFKSTFQDRFGEEWKDGFVRAFEFHRLSTEDIEAALGFFSDLLALKQSIKGSSTK
jgi:hypothetical protein